MPSKIFQIVLYDNSINGCESLTLNKLKQQIERTNFCFTLFRSLEKAVHRMQEKVDPSELKHLLQSLENSDIRIRLRGMGEQWLSFCKLVLLSDSAMILQADDKPRIILGIRSVMEFQLEQNFSGYDASVIYEVAH